ncbi:MAG: histidine kinase [Planctomycetota bacterium]
MNIPAFVRNPFLLPGCKPSLLLLVAVVAITLGVREYILFHEMSSIKVFSGISDLSMLEIQAPPWYVVASHAFMPSALWILCAPLIIIISQHVAVGRVSLGKLMCTHLIAGLVLGWVLSYLAQFIEGYLPPAFLKCQVSMSEGSLTVLGDFSSSSFDDSLSQKVLDSIEFKGDLPLSGQGIHLDMADQFSTPKITAFLDFFTTYIVIVSLLSLLLYHQFVRERDLRSARLQAQLTSAQLKAIRSQLQPHFLFNTLNGIGTLMGQDVGAARRMLGKLADLLRFSLRTMERSESTIEEELGFLKKYIDIERARFGDGLSVEIDVEPETLGLDIPSFCLQPLVENAVRHGVGRRASLGQVTVRVFCRDKDLCIEVGDDGPGLPQGQGGPLLGVGLTNVKQSLHFLYGDVARMEFDTHDGHGFVVRLWIPRSDEAKRES